MSTTKPSLFKNPLPTLGRLRLTGPCLSLIVLAGLAEGFGIALFVPLLEILSGAEGTNAMSGPLFGALNDLGLILGPDAIAWLLGGIVAFITSGLVIAYAQNYLLARVTHGHIRDLRRKYLKTLFASSLGVIVERSHGEAANHIATEAHRAGYALQSEVQAAAFFILIVIYVLFSAALSPSLLLGSLVFAAITIVVIWPLHRRARRLGENINAANHALSFHALDFMRAGRLIKASASEDTATRRLDDYTGAVHDAFLAADELRIRTYHLQQALPVLMVAGLIGLSYGFLDIPAPLILTFLLFLARIAPRITQLQQQRHTYAIHGPAIDAVNATILEAERNAETGLKDKTRPHLTFANAIDLDGVTYHYTDAAQAAVNGVDLKIAKNTMIALVGSSGSGKSTLADIIAGLRPPTDGHVRVDGQDMWQGDVLDWRAHSGYVSQDITVLNDTVRANLTFAHAHASDDDIAEALKIARMDDVIANLPQGLDTVLGEAGVKLSGGQRQRLALARALIGHPNLLILDEATSALDNESERLIQAAIEAIARHVTIVVIAHRLSTVRRADMICVLEDGRIVERGTFDSLINDGNRFAELHQLQLS